MPINDTSRFCNKYGILQISLLFDFYGELLTQKQKNIFQLYYDNDLSLSEIAQELSVSRQAVSDQLNRTQHILEGYEQKLHLVERFTAQKQAVSKIKEIVYHMEQEGSLSEECRKSIDEIKRIADDILE